MNDDRHDGYAAFEQDHKGFGVTKTERGPTLRTRSLIAALLTAIAFWTVVAYAFTA